MEILVTGAAGYIGSIITEELVNAGENVIALDNLQQGHTEAINPSATFVRGDLADTELLNTLFESHKITMVIHMAAEALVGESMYNPEKYFRTNVVYAINFLNCMLHHGVDKIVFSSSAATYGIPAGIPITEDFPQIPINPYGETKLIFEKILFWYAKIYNLKYIILRYFNAAGASKKYGEDHSPETHLIPNILNVAMGQSNFINIYGTDYPTKDGSCIRDYVHVIDIAAAHILSIDKLNEGTSQKAYNLGSDNGYSVIEVIENAKRVTGKRIQYINKESRPGDPPILVASSVLARKELNWNPKYQQLGTIIESAWHWKQTHPSGYSNDPPVGHEKR